MGFHRDLSTAQPMVSGRKQVLKDTMRSDDYLVVRALMSAGLVDISKNLLAQSLNLLHFLQ
jgi:hypothetical protein